MHQFCIFESSLVEITNALAIIFTDIYSTCTGKPWIQFNCVHAVQVASANVKIRYVFCFTFSWRAIPQELCDSLACGNNSLIVKYEKLYIIFWFQMLLEECEKASFWFSVIFFQIHPVISHLALLQSLRLFAKHNFPQILL